jgi:integrase
MVIGTPKTLTPEKAREAGEKLLASTKLGADPAAERTSHRKAETVGDLLDSFVSKHLKPKRKDGTIRLNNGYIKNHIRPALGRKKATTVTHSDIDRLHRKIGETHPVTANRVVSLIGTIFAFGLRTKALPKGTENPVTGIEPFDEKPRQRYLTGEELLRLGETIREAETVGIPWEPDPAKKTKHAPKPENRRTKIDQHAAAALRLLLFTGCRLREILDLRWSEYDAGRGLLFLPDSKTGQKTIVLAAPAIALLDSLPRAGVFVVAGESAGTKNEKPRSDLNKPWRSIRKRAGIEDVRIHDLRHSFASIGVGAGLGLPIIGNLLGHTQASTTQRYAHVAADPARRAVDVIAGKIADAMNGK